MDVSYVVPLRDAWTRSVRLLFRPFRIETWLTLGLAAFLSQLGSSGGGGTGANWDLGRPGHGPSADELRGAGGKLFEVLSHPAWLFVIAAVLMALGVLLVVLLWVNARAEFVFLHQVASGRPEFRAPWSRHARLGHSLFLWNAGFSFAWLIPLGIVAATLWPSVLIRVREQRWSLPPPPELALGCAAFVLSLLAVGFVIELVRAFVVPLMYRYDETVLQAWARFMPLLRARLVEFIAYPLFVIVLCIGVGIALVLAVIASCCVLGFLLLVPYVGTLVLLPVLVPGRALGPQFLAQFGPEWRTLEELPAPPPATTPGAGSAPA